MPRFLCKPSNFEKFTVVLYVKILEDGWFPLLSVSQSNLNSTVLMVINLWFPVSLRLCDWNLWINHQIHILQRFAPLLYGGKLFF